MVNYYDDVQYIDKRYDCVDCYCIPRGTDEIRFYNYDDELIGSIFPDDMQSAINELEHGADPILDGWEDGCGQTLSPEGW